MGNIAPQHSASGKSQSEPLTPVRMAGIKSGNDRCRRGCGKTDREAHRGDTGHDHPAPSEVTTHCSEELNGPSGVSAPEKKACAETKVWLGEFTVLSPSPPPRGNGPGVRQQVGGPCGGVSSHPGTLGPGTAPSVRGRPLGRAGFAASQRVRYSTRSLQVCARRLPGERAGVRPKPPRILCPMPEQPSDMRKLCRPRPLCASGTWVVGLSATPFMRLGSALPRCVSASGRSWKSGCQRRGSRSQV